jgi:hypothetical protein
MTDEPKLYEIAFIAKVAQMERFANHLSKKLTTVRSAIKKAQHI